MDRLCDIMFQLGLNRRRISSTLKLLCLLALIISTIIILFHQTHEPASLADQVPEPRGRISSSSGSWVRENRGPSILSRKVKNHPESIPESGTAAGGGAAGGRTGEEDGDLFAASASQHNGMPIAIFLFVLSTHYDYAFFPLHPLSLFSFLPAII